MAWWPDVRPEDLGEVDVRRPNSARMYDYYLGGSANFEADRQAAAEVIAAMPDAVVSIRENRAFLGRAVRFCVEQGVDQFLDLGSGVPTVGNVHEVAQALNPAARVAYVDNEPVAAAHGRQLLGESKLATVTECDLREVDHVLGAEGVAGLLDFDRPVAVLMVSVLNFIADDAEARDVVRGYTEALSPGSLLALSHVTPESVEPEAAERVAELYRKANPPSFWRSREQIAALVEGFDLVPPGLVPPSQWHPDSEEPVAGERVAYLAGVARVR